MALAVLAIVGASSGPQVALFASCTTFCIFAINAGLYLYSPSCTPPATAPRAPPSAACGTASASSSAPSWSAASSRPAGSLRLVFAQLAVVAAVGAVIAFFAVETKGKTLEELNS